MNTELKITIMAACLAFLLLGMAIGYLITLLTHRSKLHKEEYLLGLRSRGRADTITLIRRAATDSTALELPDPPTAPEHRRPSPSLLARQREYPLHVGAPVPNHKTLIWDRLSVQPISEG